VSNACGHRILKKTNTPRGCSSLDLRESDTDRPRAWAERGRALAQSFLSIDLAILEIEEVPALDRRAFDASEPFSSHFDEHPVVDSVDLVAALRQGAKP